MRKQYENLTLENPGIDPGTSHMQSERSTIWANPPVEEQVLKRFG